METTQNTGNPPGSPIVEIPSKWEILPIHASDVAAFKRCRRYWNWSSPTKTNLRRRVDIHGIYFPLWFGSGIHYALEQYYHPILKRDPVEAFKTWYEYQWNGGIVTYDWLDRLYDLNPRPIIDANPSTWGKEFPQTYLVQGLKELHPSPDHEEFERHHDLGIGMLNFYKDYSTRNDHFECVSSEAKFSIPLGFEAIDFREDSPNYRNKLEVHARGTRDAILFNPDSERYGLLEHKSAADIGDDYFIKLEMDEQVGTYFWASQHEAKVYDLPWKRIDRVIYNVLRKVYPKPPTILKDGITPSVNRKEESTTAEMFAAYIKEAGIESIYHDSTKMQSYYNYLVEMGDNNFVQRKIVLRNQAQIDAIARHYKMVAEEMLSPSVQIYPTPSGNWLCTHCQFRAPCLAADDGSDYVAMLADGYEVNQGR